MTYKRPNSHAIAAACGVARTTVLRVLRNPESADTDVLRRVLQCAGIAPKVNPTLTPGVTPRIGILTMQSWADLLRPGYFASVFDAILEEADRRDYHVTLLNPEKFAAGSTAGVREVLSTSIHGLILLSPPDDPAFFAAFEAHGLPFVRTGLPADDDSQATVDIDHVAAGYDATRHLSQLGHSRIAFIGPMVAGIVRLRYEGYVNALRLVDIEPLAAWDMEDTYKSAASYDFVLSRFRSMPSFQWPTAIVCWNDECAFGVLRAMWDLGLRVPNMVSVIGIDDHPDACTQEPPLTTLRQQYEVYGRAALDLLTAQIHGEPLLAPQVYLPAILVKRSSTAPPPMLPPA